MINNNSEFYMKCLYESGRNRRDALQITYELGGIGAHIGGTLSLIEVMTVLYLGFVNFDKNNAYSESRDRVIFSKGHGALALYTAMRSAGIISNEVLGEYKHNDTLLSAHPSINQELGIEFSSGSLGQGLSLGVGVCLALERKKNATSKVYVILGDGECNEGSVWEAAESAAHFGCNRLVAVIDRNHLQYDGNTAEVMNDISLEEKWRSFGWDVSAIDGHNVVSIVEALTMEHTKPRVIIADTVKGKGVSFMENNPVWHNHALNKKQYEQAIRDAKEMEATQERMLVEAGIC